MSAAREFFKREGQRKDELEIRVAESVCHHLCPGPVLTGMGIITKLCLSNSNYNKIREGGGREEGS